MKRVIVFGSGFGSNFEAIIRGINEEGLPINILYVFSDNPEAYILERAKKHGIEAKVIDYNSIGNRREFNDRVLDMLIESEPFDLLVLAGYMRILPPSIVRRYYGKIINIHPSLLPAFRGLHAVERAFEAGVKVTGVTVHFVDEGVDTGPIIEQIPVRIEEGETLDSLFEKIHRVEHSLYLKVIKKLLGLEDKPRYALFSIQNKDGAEKLAKYLKREGYTLLSTGGTARYLKDKGISTVEVEFLTGFPEMMEGKVKTLHPIIFGGVLHDREKDRDEARRWGLPDIRYLVINFYDLREEDFPLSIDVGGPALLRAALKMSKWVTPIVSPDDYDMVIDSMNRGEIPDELRKELIRKAAHYLAQYHIRIAELFEDEFPPSHYYISCERKEKMRYGENPHEEGYVYGRDGLISSIEIIRGKPFSYTNWIDIESAIEVLSFFDEPAGVVIKHTNPSGVALRNRIDLALLDVIDSDRESAFGGVMAVNRRAGKSLIKILKDFFFDILIAPDFSEEFLEAFSRKKRTFVKYSPFKFSNWRIRFVEGGLLLKEEKRELFGELKIYGPPLNEDEKREIEFGLKVVKCVKSNAIVVTKNLKTVGIGPAQTSRVEATRIALRKAGERARGAFLFSDGFFPFPDSIELAHEYGISTVVEPGGSIRDDMVIEKAQELGIRLILTGLRLFKH